MNVLNEIRKEILNLTECCMPELILNTDVLAIIDKYIEREEKNHVKD